MANYLAPILNSQQEDQNGNPLSGGLIETYLAGTSTPAVTYSTQAGVANTNPIVLNTLGVNNQGAVWLTGGSAYKFIIKNSVGVVQRTIDNVSGINDTAVTADQWVVYQAVPIYVSATSFTVAGDQTQIFQVGRRVRTTNTGGTVYSTITASAYSAPNTTVTVVNDSGVLDSGLSSVSYGIISVQNTSLPPGRLVRTLVYLRVAGVQNVIIDGAAPTTTGATTYSALAGSSFAIVEATGAGGGSGGNPTTTAAQQAFTSGGGGGSFGIGRYAAPLSGIAVSVGAAGAAGAAGGNGGAGGATTFGALLSAPGGPGSLASTAGGGVSGAASTAGGGVPTGANLVAIQGGASLQCLSAALGFFGSLAGGASGSGVTNGYGTGAGGKYNGVSTASPQPGVAATEGGLLVVREYA